MALEVLPTRGSAQRPPRARTRPDGGRRPRHPGARPPGQRPLRDRARRSCGWPAPGRSARSAWWSARPARSTCNSTWDEGIPDEIPHDHLYGIAWNPMTLIEVLKSIAGAADRRPGRHRRPVTDVRPAAADGLPDRRTRRRRSPRCAPPGGSRPPTRSTRSAARSASPSTALAAAVGRAGARRDRAGADRRDHGGDGGRRGHHARHPGRRVDHAARTTRGVASPATAASPTATWWRFDAGCVADGYVGEVGRTWPVGDVAGAVALFRRSDELWERLVDACRPGAPASDLLDGVRGGRRAAARRCRWPTVSASASTRR